MRSSRPATDDRGSLQIIVVTLNGNNATLQDALRTVDAMSKRNLNGTPRTSLAPGKSRGSSNGTHAPAVDEEEDEAPLFVDADAEEATEEDDAPPASRGQPRKSRPTVPKSVPDLNLNGATPSFRDFAKSKAPADQFDWYLLFSYWMKHHMATEEIGIDHVYTASHYIGADWSLPEDVGQPFRDMRRKSLFVKGTKKGLSKITHNGEDRVKRMGTSA